MNKICKHHKRLFATELIFYNNPKPQIPVNYCCWGNKGNANFLVGLHVIPGAIYLLTHIHTLVESHSSICMCIFTLKFTTSLENITLRLGSQANTYLYTQEEVDPEAQQTNILYTHTNMYTPILNTHNWSTHLHIHTGAWWGHMTHTEPEAVRSYWVTVILAGWTKWSQLKIRGGCFCLLSDYVNLLHLMTFPPLLPHFLTTQRPYLLACADFALLIPVYTQDGKLT